MALERNGLIFLAASALARREKKSLKKWCIERGICPTTIYKFAQVKSSRLSSAEKVLISMFDEPINKEIYDYKKRLLQMV